MIDKLFQKRIHFFLINKTKIFLRGSTVFGIGPQRTINAIYLLSLLLPKKINNSIDVNRPSIFMFVFLVMHLIQLTKNNCHKLLKSYINVRKQCVVLYLKKLNYLKIIYYVFCHHFELHRGLLYHFCQFF